MESKIRYGIIGCGMIAQEHIRNLALFPEVEIVSIADPVADCIAMTKATLGATGDAVRVYDNAADLCAAGDIDVVIVSSPNHTHRDVLAPVFASGVHILCEKPLATTIPDAVSIRDKAATHPGIFWTAMEYRFMPPAQALVARLHA
jgi:myo-inositol 2-dehydrogenase / D-chiro-inositol 1-dehydrogenase